MESKNRSAWSLQSQPSVLDLVAAVERLLLANKNSDPSSLLFQTEKGPVSKKLVIKLLESVWGPSSLDKWMGYSFRVGGGKILYTKHVIYMKIA